MKGLAWLGRHATEALIVGVFVGLMLPDMAAAWEKTHETQNIPANDG